LRECRECRAGGHSAKANVGIEVLDIDVGLLGVGEGGMPGRNVQRKPVAKGLYPKPPQLATDGVEDDSEGVSM
jgi:hypothetical protein